MKWPFTEPPNVAVFTSKHVVEAGEPIFYVTHDSEDGAWQFHAQNHMETTDDDICLVALEEIFSRDPSIGSLHDLPLGWQAWRQTPSADWQRQQKPQGNMYYFLFDAVPTRENSEFEVIGGAAVCCWIIADSVESAEKHARESIENSHWFIKDLEETLETGTDYYEADDSASRFVRQAEIDGEVFVFHTYPAHEDETENES